MRRLVAPRNLENRFHGDYAVAVPYLGAPNSAIRALFKDELGVLFLNRPGKKNKRSYVSMRIPASVAKRVYDLHLRYAPRNVALLFAASHQ
jgi:hypothetical protein